MLVGSLEGGKCRTRNAGDEAGRLDFRLSSTFRHANDGLGLVVLVEVRTLVDAFSRWTGGKPRGAGTPSRATILTRRDRPHAPAAHEVTCRIGGMCSVGVFLQSASCQIAARRRWWRKSVPPPARIHPPATRLGTAPFWLSNHESVRGVQSHPFHDHAFREVRNDERRADSGLGSCLALTQATWSQKHGSRTPSNGLGVDRMTSPFAGEGLVAAQRAGLRASALSTS